MAISDIPTNFGAASFMRNFLPGFLFTIILSYTFLPISPYTAPHFAALDLTSKLIFFIITGFVLGLIISSRDFDIYKTLGGYKTGTSVISRRLYERKLRSYENQNELNTKLNNNNLDLASRIKLSEIGDTLREYPFNLGRRYFYPETWTRL